jgi:hypothetical protein
MLQTAEDGCSSSNTGIPNTAVTAVSIEQKQWNMLLDFTKKQFTGTAAALYTSSREKRDALREAILVRN